MPTDPSPPFGREPSPVEAEALAWFGRRDRGLTPWEERDLTRWLGEDPSHREVFEELCGTWRLLDGVQPQAGVRRRRPAPAVLWVGAALAAAACCLAYFGPRRPGLPPPANYAQAAHTDIGGLNTLTLPDGSKVELNTATSVSVVFSTEERRVRLSRGEALFTIAKNPQRPFYVEAGGVVVKAVGTAFNVRLDPKSVEVLVTEGKVRIDDSASGKSLLATDGAASGPGAEPLLIAGHSATIPLPLFSPDPADAAVAAVAPDELGRRLAWQRHQIAVDSAPLSELVAEFNRYNRRQLAIGDQALGSRRFGGSFRSDDSAGFVRMLRENFGIRADERDGVTVLTPER